MVTYAAHGVTYAAQGVTYAAHGLTYAAHGVTYAAHGLTYTAQGITNNMIQSSHHFSQGKLVIRTGISGLKPLGSGWEVMPVSYVKECHVGRLEGCAWVVDTAGVVHFQVV